MSMPRAYSRTAAAMSRHTRTDTERNADRPRLAPAPVSIETLDAQRRALAGKADACARRGDLAGQRRHGARAAEIARQIADVRAAQS